MRSARRSRHNRLAVPIAAEVQLLEERNLLDAGISGGLLAMTDFAPAPLATVSAAAVKPPAGAATPAEILKAYGITSYIPATAAGNSGAKSPVVHADGTGQTVAVVSAFVQPNVVADLKAFSTAFHLQAPDLTVHIADGAPNAPLDGAWGEETSMDVEWVHAIAPGAKILLVEAKSNQFIDLLDGVLYAENQPGVAAITMSWGVPEGSPETVLDHDFTTPAGHTPITFLAGAGDHHNGEPGLYPAFSPNVMSVGGTSLTLDKAGNYSNEIGWDDGTLDRSGGGISQFESQPAWQQGVVTQSATMRATPDVSFDAGQSTIDGNPVGQWVAIYDSYDFGTKTPWGNGGGTSLASPCWAGLIAIADQARALLNQASLDTPGVATWLYSAYHDGFGAQVFHDITSGNNGFAAGPGYDLMTGLGSPIGPAVLAGLSGNLQAPKPIGPKGTVKTLTPTFTWSSVAGALGYQIIAVDATTHSQVLNVSFGGSATSYTAPSGHFISGHTYSWQVAALTIGASSVLSTSLTFKVQVAAPAAIAHETPIDPRALQIAVTNPASGLSSSAAPSPGGPVLVAADSSKPSPLSSGASWFKTSTTLRLGSAFQDHGLPA
jgi:subtilase family serine protease